MLVVCGTRNARLSQRRSCGFAAVSLVVAREGAGQEKGPSLLLTGGARSFGTRRRPRIFGVPLPPCLSIAGRARVRSVLLSCGTKSALFKSFETDVGDELESPRSPQKHFEVRSRFDAFAIQITFSLRRSLPLSASSDTPPDFSREAEQVQGTHSQEPTARIAGTP